MWITIKAFNEFVTILFLFYVFFFFGSEARGIFTSPSSIKPTSLELEGEVLTTRPAGEVP